MGTYHKPKDQKRSKLKVEFLLNADGFSIIIEFKKEKSMNLSIVKQNLSVIFIYLHSQKVDRLACKSKSTIAELP